MAEKPKCFQIGRWQVEPDAGSMSDGRETVQVPPRLLRLLQILVEGAGDTVSREELIEALWPRGYVNEEALSRAVNELRGLLGDDARTPEFIRTIPKKGYRLIANVGTVSERKKPPHHLVGLILVGPIFMAVVLVMLLWKTSVAPPPADVLSTAKRLTSDPGMEWHPEISSNGQWVAQVVIRDGRGAIQLFPTAAPEQKREITHPDGLYSPAFSPDASQLATLAGHGEACRILLWPVAGGDVVDEASAVSLGPCYRLTTLAGLDWSADGEWLAFPNRDPQSGAAVLNRVRLSDGRVLPLTRLSDPYQSDESPRFSPDGKWLSFSRGTRAVRELWMQNLGDMDEMPRQLTRDGQFTSGHDWWPDSQSIVLDSDRSGHRALWNLDFEGEMTLLGARDAQLPSVTDDGAVLFQVAQYEANIWRLDLVSGVLDPDPLVASTKYDSMPSWSPDGSEIAFTSNRSGDGGIWIASADGSRVRMVYTPEEGRAVGPHWLADGTALLATEYTSHAQRIVRIALNRREVLNLETPGSHPYAPSESPDRKWIYYLAGGESGGSDLWRMPASGSGGHELILKGPLNRYVIAEDRNLYFTRYRKPGLWRRNLDEAGDSDLLLEHFPTWAGEDWTIHGNWFYHANDDGLLRFNLGNGELETVSEVFSNSLGPSIDVHPLGHTILLSKTDRAESDLFLARTRRH